MALLAPSKTSTPDVWASENRHYGASAAIPGARDPELTPYIIEIERLVASGTCKRVVLACASQMGKAGVCLRCDDGRLRRRGGRGGPSRTSLLLSTTERSAGA
jgi:hypothetical protein